MENDSRALPSSLLGTRWRSSTTRWLVVYTVMFSISVLLLVGFIDAVARRTVTSDTDAILDWQLIYFDSVPDSQLQQAIFNRREREQLHTNFYGLFSTDGRHLAGDIMAMPAGFRADRTGVTLNNTLDTAGTEHLAVVRAVGERRSDGGVLVIARDVSHEVRIREAIVNTLIATGLVVLVSGIMGGFIVGVKQMRRVRSIRTVVNRIALGDLHQRIPEGGRDELDLLAHFVNHMLDEVERLMGEVKTTCDAIAHDLRTPLSHIRVLLSRIAADRVIEENMHVDSMVEEACLETDRLLEQFSAMLRISEIGTLQRRGGFSTVDLNELVRSLGELYEPLAETKNIEWVVCSEHVEPIHADRALLFEALSNLIDNAIKFTPEDGRIGISLSISKTGPQIEVVDNGIGIPIEDRHKVPGRFYRGDHARRVPGSGLGLSIVSAILRVHDFGLQIGDARPGTRMTVQCWPHAIT
jgi:signal transduction histidine kinase